MKLNNQEIRNCIYGGTFNRLLKELDEYPAWRKINKMRPKQSYRFTKQEIILRFFSFHDRASTYEGHLAKFLNAYMHDHQNPPETFIAQKRTLFQHTVEAISTRIFSGEAPPKLSVTVLEAVLVGVSKNIANLLNLPAKTLRARYEQLTNHDEFSEAALKEGLSKKPRVTARLNTAASIFSGTN
jgi:hypothetical protein